MDGSERAYSAFQWSLKRVRSNDTVVVLHIRNEERESIHGFDPLVEIGERVR